MTYYKSWSRKYFFRISSDLSRETKQYKTPCNILVSEFMANGDLKNFIKSNRSEIDEPQQAHFAADIARGMR